MENVSLVTVIVAVLGAGGLGVFIREIADIVSKVRRGVSTRESNRKNDIITQRDLAVTRATEEQRKADAERARRIAWQEYAGLLAFQLRMNGISPNPLPDGIEETINPAT